MIKIDILVVLLDIGLTLDNSAVFQSQVGEQIIYLRKQGFEVGIICISNNHDIFNKVIGNKFIDNGVKVFNINSEGFFKNFYNIIKTGRGIQTKYNIGTYYVRGIWGGISILLMNALKYKKIPFVYDVRGDLKDELVSVGVSPLKKRLYLFLESFCISRAYSLSAVTTKLIEVIQNRYVFKRSVVIPCCIDFNFFQINDCDITEEKKKLGIGPNDLILIYSGGLSHYQQVPKMLELWSNLLDLPDIKFILLTNEDPHSHPTTIKYQETFGERLIHLSVPRNHVPLILNTADIAFLLRDDRQLNKVASPVKFAEYISCGLKVITSPLLGDVHHQVIKNNLGILIEPDFTKDDIIRFRNFIAEVKMTRSKQERIRIKKIALALYDWSSYSDTFNKLYKRT
jgi:glycosyltransferase involved in cell wall biosynthesis